MKALRNVNPASLYRRLLHGVQHLRNPPPSLEIAVRAPILRDGVQQLVDLDGLELVHAQRHAGERPERSVVTVGRAEFDLLVALPIRGIAGHVQPQRVDVLLNELQGALAADQLDALMPGPPGGDSGSLDVTARA